MNELGTSRGAHDANSPPPRPRVEADAAAEPTPSKRRGRWRNWVASLVALVLLGATFLEHQVPGFFQAMYYGVKAQNAPKPPGTAIERGDAMMREWGSFPDDGSRKSTVARARLLVKYGMDLEDTRAYHAEVLRRVEAERNAMRTSHGGGAPSRGTEPGTHHLAPIIR